MEEHPTDGEQVVVGRVAGVEPVRDLIEDLRARDIELLEVKDPDRYGATGSNRYLDEVAMRRYGRRLWHSAVVGLVIGALAGLVAAAVLTAADVGAFVPLALMFVGGATFVGLSIGSVIGLGSRLALEDERDVRKPHPVEDRTQVLALARRPGDVDEITEVMGRYGEVQVIGGRSSA
jgi:hypothetical protein